MIDRDKFLLLVIDYIWNDSFDRLKGSGDLKDDFMSFVICLNSFYKGV